MRKIKRKHRHPVANTFTVWLLFCAIAFSIVFYIQTVSTQRYIKDKIVEIEILCEKMNDESANVTDSQIAKMQEKYFEYCNAVDQQFNDSFNKLLAFFSCIFGVTTIVNAYTAYRLPKIQEDKLKEIDVRMNDVERYVKEADFFARIASIGVKDNSAKEKIDEITDFINDSKDPSYNLFYTRGKLYGNLNEYRKAESDYERAKELGMPLSKYHNAMGILYSELFSITSEKSQARKKEKCFNVAKKHYEEAIELYKKDGNNRKVSWCYCNLACLYHDNGQYEDSMQKFEEAINLDASNEIVYFDRAVSYHKMGKEYYKNAFDDYTKSLSFNPNLVVARQYRAELSIEMYELFGDVRYREIAQKDYHRLSKETSRLNRLQERIGRSRLGDLGASDITAKIAEKMADLSVEEAQEYPVGTEEYSKCINDAKEHYFEAMKYYQNSYKGTKSDICKESINRINGKLSKI